MPKIKLQTLSTALSVYNVTSGLYRDAKGRYDEKHIYTATLSEDSYAFNPLMIWINDQTASRKVRLVTSRYGDKVFRHFNSSKAQTFTLDGIDFKVTIGKPGTLNKDNLADSLDGVSFSGGLFKQEMVFETKNPRGFEALESLISKLCAVERKIEKPVRMHSLQSYGWQEGRTLPFRDINSVFLPAGAKENLMGDIEKFFSSEPHFAKIGVPWHRGYMLYGPPGNGKSSLVSALAHHYKLNIYNLPLSGVDDDKKLAEAVASVSQKSILLLEDIDIFSKTMSRKQEDKGPTLAGLLNALDGVATPHGLMTFMTSNHPEVLDPALVRNGRVDYRLELLPPTTEQVKAMFQFAFDEPLGFDDIRSFESMASLSEVFKSNITDPEAVRMEIKNA